MSNLLKIGLFIFIPLLVLIGVNETSPAFSHEWDKEQCTRYCHDRICHHAEDFRTHHPRLSQLYAANIRWLKKNPLGLSYAQMNLLLYVGIAPLLMLFLFWGLIRKRHG